MRLVALLTFAYFCLSAAQSPKDLFEKAPPDIDEALRTRIEKFYQSFVDGKYRDAYEVVAEESKDTFLGSDKYKCTQFEIVKINYSEKFTRATALVACTSQFSAGMQQFPTKVPLTSLWKVVDGKWYWYTMPVTQTMTPWGTMRSGSAAQPGSEPPSRTLPKVPDLAEILSMIKVDKYQVRLSSYESASDEVVVTNNMPGQISLSFDHPPMPGLVIKLDRETLKSHESAKITFQCKPADKAAKPALDVRLKVEPLNQVIPIRVVFAIPPEIEKQLPKN